MHLHLAQTGQPASSSSPPPVADQPAERRQDRRHPALARRRTRRGRRGIRPGCLRRQKPGQRVVCRVSRGPAFADPVQDEIAVAELIESDRLSRIHRASVHHFPLRGYQVIEITITEDSPAAGRKLGDVPWPPASTPVSVLRGRRLHAPRPDSGLAPGDRVSLLIPGPQSPPPPLPDGVRRDQPASREGTST